MICGLDQLWRNKYDSITPRCPYCSKTEPTTYKKLNKGLKADWVWEEQLNKFTCKNCSDKLDMGRRTGKSRMKAVKSQETKRKTELGIGSLRRIPSGSDWSSDSASFTEEYEEPVRVARQVARAISAQKEREMQGKDDSNILTVVAEENKSDVVLEVVDIPKDRVKDADLVSVKAKVGLIPAGKCKDTQQQWEAIGDVHVSVQA